jgi:hypothetical protein
MVIRWLAHLNDGRTIVDGKGLEMNEVSKDICSIESISPNGSKVIVCACPKFSDFYTLVTASDSIDYITGHTIHSEDERIVGFKIEDTIIEVIIDLHSNNIKIVGKKGGHQ